VEFVVRSNKKEVRGLTENIIFLYLSLNYGDIYMDINEIISILREAIEEQNWDMIKELVDDLSTDLGNPLDGYDIDEEEVWFDNEPTDLNK